MLNHYMEGQVNSLSSRVLTPGLCALIWSDVVVEEHMAQHVDLLAKLHGAVWIFTANICWFVRGNMILQGAGMFQHSATAIRWALQSCSRSMPAQMFFVPLPVVENFTADIAGKRCSFLMIFMMCSEGLFHFETSRTPRKLADKPFSDCVTQRMGAQIYLGFEFPVTDGALKGTLGCGRVAL